MLRTVPAVPVVARGEQSFHPLWYADFGDVLAQAIDCPDVIGQTLELAGPEVTTTGDVRRRLAAIPGCDRGAPAEQRNKLPGYSSHQFTRKP